MPFLSSARIKARELCTATKSAKSDGKINPNVLAVHASRPRGLMDLTTCQLPSTRVPRAKRAGPEETELTVVKSQMSLIQELLSLTPEELGRIRKLMEIPVLQTLNLKFQHHFQPQHLKLSKMKIALLILLKKITTALSFLIGSFKMVHIISYNPTL
ncbi:hypothetical protein TYRP_012945 [Tyrophagus putrescentiae]|nr:hypothetical protein TYRP_012945 [Tyrophagus putrescentiae]